MTRPRIGILEWFEMGEHERVERVLAELAELGVSELRTGVSWADACTAEGEAWYDWLMPRLARELTVLPCFLYTPPSLGLVPRTASPPREPKAYADFLDVFITRHGEHFEWVELWNEPNNLSEWDWTLDHDWHIFCEMVGGAAYWARQRGKKVALGGMSPTDPNWLDLMFRRGVMRYVDAIGIHGFPGSWEVAWEGWPAAIAKAQAVLDAHGSPAEVWITETGYSTWRHDERAQLDAFLAAASAPVPRMYWYAAHDLAPHRATVDGFHSDEREYHFGLRTANGQPKLLARLWAQGGREAVEAVAKQCTPLTASPAERPVLITGGAGFVGTNLADRLARDGRCVILYDNLSRPGVERNLAYLRETHGDRVHFELADVRDPYRLRACVEAADQVFHLAAQVAVTTSLVDPVADFEINARGTLNLLEALRASDTAKPLVFTSTNKVYGGLEDVGMVERDRRYAPADAAIDAAGISEARALDFHSPYGCSKGAADQYVLDYARTYGLPAAVFRMSCIYGPHQFGTEDQGWVAHFLIRAIEGRPITLYGDGRQVRDVLFASDLVEAFLAAMANMDALAGQAFNIGGGPSNTVSLLELISLISAMHGSRQPVEFGAWRPGDQRYYVSDTSKFLAATGWQPQVSVQEGVERLYHWLRASRGDALAPLMLEREAS